MEELQAAKEALAKARPARAPRRSGATMRPRAVLALASRPLTAPAAAQNLQAKQQSWSAQAKAAGGVIAEGVDSQAPPAATAASLPSVDKDTFYPTINGAGDTLVVVDFYTDWCAAGALLPAQATLHGAASPGLGSATRRAARLTRARQVRAVQADDAQAGGDEPGARPRPPPLRCAAHAVALVVAFAALSLTPCGVAFPAQEYKDVKFVKCNCNKEFKDIGKALGIKVARACPHSFGCRCLPHHACLGLADALSICSLAATFHLYRQGKQLAVMTGAKVDELRELILAHK